MRGAILIFAITTVFAASLQAAEPRIQGAWHCFDKNHEGELDVTLTFGSDGHLDTRLELAFEESQIEIRGVVRARSTYELLPSGVLKDKTLTKELVSLTADGFDIKNHSDTKELQEFLLAEDDTPTKVVSLTQNSMSLASYGDTIACQRTSD
ncbi:MAG: hypothetical protein MK208_04270 [Shimia sp.]|nr:hypothetical protein [Shimia sp.]